MADLAEWMNKNDKTIITVAASAAAGILLMILVLVGFAMVMHYVGPH